jgi:hypothetical protein
MVLAFFLVALPLPAQAALSPETDQPYQFRIVLQIADSRLLQGVFKDRIRRELRENFQAALGRMAKVEVVEKSSLLEELHSRDQAPSKERQMFIDRTLALLKEVDAKGLQQALDGWHEVSETKTHFVRIDFANGQYTIQTRQFDGLNGMPSPVVRHDQTEDREVVARTAALLIAHDFGVVGTLPAAVQGPEIQVLLKGGTLGELHNWVEKDDVFAVSQIQEGVRGQGSGVREQRAYRLPDTLLQVMEEPHEGGCRCRLLSRYANPLKTGPGVLGFRCLKLGTTEAPLRLQIVTAEPPETPLAHAQVLVASTPQGPAEADVVTDPDGMVQLDRRFRTVAFVRVVPNKGVAPIQIPVEIVATRMVVLKVSPNIDKEKVGALVWRLGLWQNRAVERLLATNGLVADLNTLIRAKKHQEALAAANDGLRVLETDGVSLRDELNALKADAAGNKIKPGGGLDIPQAEQRLAQLQAKRDELRASIANIREAIDTENDPKRKEWLDLAAQAQQEESLCEFGKAIDLYEKIVKEGGNAPGFQKYTEHLNALKKAWAIKNISVKGVSHAQARDFIYRVWSNAAELNSAARLKLKIDDVFKALETCKAAQDVKSPLKIQFANLTYTATLKKELDTFSGDQSPDARKNLETVSEVIEKMRKLEQELDQYLKNTSKAP